MDDFARQSARELRARRKSRQQRFWLHLVVWLGASVVLVMLWAFSDVDALSALVVIAVWGVVIAVHAVRVFVVHSPEELMVNEDRPAADRDR